jgi:hypothetical protein
MDPSALLGLPQLGQPEIGKLAGGHRELLVELRSLSPVQTAATFSGLLTKPELQANCLRLEALVHF